MKFTPTVLEVKNMLSQRLSDGIEMICARPMLADDPEFKSYMVTLEMSEEKDEGKFNPLKAISEMDELLQKKGEIASVLDSAFSQLEGYEKELVPYIKIYKNHSALDFSKLEGESDAVYRRWVYDFEKDRITITDSLAEEKVLGIISVDASNMKQTILKKPKESKEEMERLIPDHSDKIVDRLMDLMKEIEGRIVSTTIMDDVDEYVRYKKFLEEHRKNADDYEAELMKAKALHQILQESQMRISVKRKKDLDTLDGKWKTVKEKLKTAYENCEKVETSQKAKLLKKSPEIKEKIKKLLDELSADKFFTALESPSIIVDELLSMVVKIKQFEQVCNNIIENATYLNVQRDDFKEIEILKEKQYHLLSFWKDQQIWSDKKQEWYQKPITGVDTENMRKILTEMSKTALQAENTLRKNFEIEFKLANEFQTKYLQPMLSTINVIDYIRQDTILPRHWERIQRQINCTHEIKDKEFSFEILVGIIQKTQASWAKEKSGFPKVENWIRSIADQAKQENKLDVDYKKVKLKWKKLYLMSKQVGESKIWQLEEPEKKIEEMNDCMINLQKILGNQYADPLRSKAEKLYKNISLIEEILDEMILVEKKLKIADELLKKEEFKGINLGNRFEEAHKDWRKYVKNQSKETLNQRYLKLEKEKDKDKDKEKEKEKVDFLSIFQTMNKNMDGIMYDFEIKIEEKQEECPRLFFLSNKEYIRILINSQVDAKKQDILTYAMAKCFASVKEILTVVENDEIFPIGVISLEGEELRASVKAKSKIADSIEKVFPAMEELFKKELKSRIKAYVADYASEKKSRSELLLSSLAQVAMMGEREIFTGNTEIVIEEDEGYEDNMKVFFEEQCLACAEAGKILSQGGIQLSSTGSQASQPNLILTETKRIALSGIIIQYVHFRDVIDYLLQNDAHGANSFFWQIQLKNYRQPDGTSYIKQMDAVIEYGCEYLGVRNVSPITPNVERCWLSYTSALRNRFWSTVVGPPDQGKQNTIQDLASALGKFFFLYVCNHDTTARVLEKLVMGTVSSFGWTVFEKANELQYGVLSAFAFHLMNLRQILLEGVSEWHPLKARTINMYPKSQAIGVNTPYHGFFLLVDHTSGNKIEVPHSIKYLFRPVAITVLQLAPLGESFLFSFGFKDARSLGYKLAFFLKSAKDMLSIEGFACDFGWRTLSTIVKTASALKRKLMETHKESQILFMAIQTLFKSRLNEQALTNIEKIAQIVFEETDIKNKAQESPAFSNEIIEKAQNNLKIQYETDIAQKLIELKSAFAKSFAVVIVGEAACGKSTLIDLFNECYKLASEATQEKCDTIKIFPKSFNLSELYGRYESKDWLDGIFVHILQTLTNSSKKLCFNILHCDGPLDPQWVEHLQAGFDGERKMSLANGDFIFLKNDVKVLFEVEDLKQASPSLVSRSSIIYMQNDLVTPRNIISKWLISFKDKINCYELISEILTKNIEELFYNGLNERNKISKLKEEEIRLPPNVIALTFCKIFETTFLKLMPGILEKEKHDENMKKFVGKTFVFALAWSLGGSLNSLKVKKIEDYVDSEISIGDKPKDMMCFDAFLRITQGIAEWVSWADYEIPYQNPLNGTFTQIIIPTKQLMRYFWFVDALATKSSNILLFGESGSGKSLVAAHAIMQDKGDSYLPSQNNRPLVKKQTSIILNEATKGAIHKFTQINVCFTWHTTPGKFQKIIEERLDKKEEKSV